MKTKFKIIRKQNIFLSSLICFIKMLCIKKYNKGAIKRGFNELVSTYDYNSEDKDEILEYCYKIND